MDAGAGRRGATDLRSLWRGGYRYLKVGVVLDDLRDAATEPRSLSPTRDPRRSARLLVALDTVNAQHGQGTLRPLATGVGRAWGTRHNRRSARYTTRVDELMEAEAW